MVEGVVPIFFFSFSLGPTHGRALRRNTDLHLRLILPCSDRVLVKMSDPYSSQNGGHQSQPSQRRSRRPRCPQCGSKRFRRDMSTSLVVCEFGHVLQGFRDEEAQDGDEFNTNRTQMHRRSIKVQGPKRSARLGRKKMSVAATGGELAGMHTCMNDISP